MGTDTNMMRVWILGLFLVTEILCSTPGGKIWKKINQKKGKSIKSGEKENKIISSKLQKRKASPDKPFFAQQTTSSNSGGYGAPEKEEAVDLHKGEFCVDVSTFQPVVWVERDGEECNTVFVKDCQDRTEQICQDVTETKCEVVPYKECKLGQQPQEFTETKLTPKRFIEKACSQGKKTIPHKKLLPECRNVTRQNCVTLWETDSYGKQQWAGTDACEPSPGKSVNLSPRMSSSLCRKYLARIN